MKNVAIVGASGAIGSAFVKLLNTVPSVEKIYALSRTPTTFDIPQVTCDTLDLQDEASISHVAQRIIKETRLDTILITTGILHNASYMPEKSLHELSSAQFQQVFAINTIGPALIMKHFLPLIEKNERAVIAILSARVGSISDNHLGGWYSYRASKAALNMLIKSASIEIARRDKQTIVIGLHPGTVDSALSKPFQKNIPPQQLFQAKDSAVRMLKVIMQLTPEDTGKCFAYDGKEIQP